MAKWVSAGVLDGGLNYINSTVTKMYLLSAYSVGNSYATVIANALNAGITMAPADLVLSTSGTSRVLTTAVKTAAATASATGTPDLHFAFTDGSSQVIWVTDETTNQPITAGNTLNFPALTYTSTQPV